MNSFAKWLIAGAVILGIGVCVIIIGLALNGWKWGADYETKDFTSAEQVTELDLNAAAGNLYVEFYDGEDVEISYPVSDYFSYSVTEQDGTVKLSYSNKWYAFFNFGWWSKPMETHVKIPASLTADVSVRLSAGQVFIADGSFGKVNLHVSAGTLAAGNIQCGQLVCDVSAGALKIAQATSESVKCHVSAGSFAIDRLVCPVIDAEVSAGSASLKVVGEESAYSVSVDKSAGSCNVSGKTGTDPTKRIGVHVSAGSVDISFVN